MVAVRTCVVVACSSIDWLLQLPGAVLLIGRAPFVYWGVSNCYALTEVFLLPRIQLCSLHRLNWLLLPYDYRHDYFLVSSMLKLSSLKPSKYTRWIFASIGRFVTVTASRTTTAGFCPEKGTCFETPSPILGCKGWFFLWDFIRVASRVTRIKSKMLPFINFIRVASRATRIKGKMLPLIKGKMLPFKKIIPLTRRDIYFSTA